MDNASFCWGLVAGFVIAGIVGFIFQRITLATKRTKAASSNQPVRGQTDLTPNQVVRNAMTARLEMAVWVVVILVVMGCLVFVWVQGV